MQGFAKEEVTVDNNGTILTIALALHASIHAWFYTSLHAVMAKTVQIAASFFLSWFRNATRFSSEEVKKCLLFF